MNPPNLPTFVWDGDCGFCKYWILVFKKNTAQRVNYVPYQESAHLYPDIPFKEFRKAVRLIEPQGAVYGGPDAAYRGFEYFEKPVYFLHRWYVNSGAFRWVSDHGYHLISENRPLMMKLTIFLWGKNPLDRKPYWLIEVVVLILLLVIIFRMI